LAVAVPATWAVLAVLVEVLLLLLLLPAPNFGRDVPVALLVVAAVAGCLDVALSTLLLVLLDSPAGLVTFVFAPAVVTVELTDAPTELVGLPGLAGVPFVVLVLVGVLLFVGVDPAAPHCSSPLSKGCGSPFGGPGGEAKSVT
jgi:hypothetical protein